MAQWESAHTGRKGSHLVEGSTMMPKWEDRSGIAIVQNNINLLPKNLAQDPMLAKGALFEIHGDQETFNIHQMLYEKTFESEYFKAMFIFKTFEKVVDVIYEKVTYVEPWAATEVRSPSSAYCLLMKLFHLRLTETQVRALLDHGDSTMIRALGALYVRYTCDPKELWRWLGEYADDLEVFAPGMDKTRTTTFGDYCLGLITDLQYFTTMLPRIPVPVVRHIKVELVLFEEMVRRGKKNVRHLEFLKPGAVVRAIFRDEGKDPAWHEAIIVARIEPYDGAAEGQLPTFRVQFTEAGGSAIEVVKTGQLDLPASVTAKTDAVEKGEKGGRDRSRRDRDRSRRDRDRGRRRRDDDEPRDRGGYDDEPRDRSGYDGERDRSRRRSDDRDKDRERSRRDRSRDRSRRDRSRRDRSRSRDRSRRDDAAPQRNEGEDAPARAEAAPARAEGESLLAGRDIMGDVIAAERAAATVDHREDNHRRPIGFNTALIVASDKYTYKARKRSRSPDKKREVKHVAAVMPRTE